MKKTLILLTLCIMASCITNKQLQITKPQLAENAVLIEQWIINNELIAAYRPPHYKYNFYNNKQFVYSRSLTYHKLLTINKIISTNPV